MIQEKLKAIGEIGGIRQEAGLTHRQQQALETRRLIVDTAKRLFVERGYAATTMEAMPGKLVWR